MTFVAMNAQGIICYSAVCLSSTESLSIIQLIILFLWPSTLLFCLSFTALLVKLRAASAATGSCFQWEHAKNPPARHQIADRRHWELATDFLHICV